MRRLSITIAALAALALLALPASAAARTLTVTNADISMSLAPDSALLVNEKLRIDYEGTWQATYRDILLKHGETITNVHVSEGGKNFKPGGCTSFGCTDLEGRFGVTTLPPGEGEGVRIVWHVNATDVVRTFDVSYRVEDAVVAYDDVLDVQWQVWGDQWEFDLEHLTASFSDPSLKPGEATPEKPSAVWGKPRDVEGRDFLEDGVARLEASDVHNGQFVEMRVLVPREPGENVNAARIESGDGLVKILEEEDALTEDFNSPFNKAKRWASKNMLALSLALAALIVGLLMLMTRMAREHPTSVPEHLPEPPDDAGPALAYGLAHEGEDTEDTVLATFLDLLDRGYYKAKTSAGDKEKLDLTVSKASKRPSGKLAAEEQEVLNFFDELLKDEEVALSDMKDRIPEHDATWRGRWESMTNALNSAEGAQLEWDRNLNGKRGWLALGVIVGFGLVALARLNVEEDWTWIVPAAIGFVTLLVVALWPATRLKRLAPETSERSAKWQAFERWTRDFPTLKDDPPATLELWKRILVFGVAFGTAERMIESGRIPAPVLESTSGWSGYYFAGGGTSHAHFGGDFSSGFSSQVAPESSSGGGGGFSGGGGGGGASGGGGGGGW